MQLLRNSFCLLCVVLFANVAIAQTGTRLTNNSGATIAQYAVVVVDDSAALSVKTTTTEADDSVIGVAYAEILDEASGVITLPGNITRVKTTGTVAIGDLLVTSTTAGVARTAATNDEEAAFFAIALEAAAAPATIRCYLGGVTSRVLMTAAADAVLGPASATDHALPRFDLTTGKLVQNSTAILSDGGALSGVTIDTNVITSGTLGTARLGSGTANSSSFLRGDQTWNSSVVSGPASATDNAVALFDGTGGKTLENSVVIINSEGDVTGVDSIAVADDVVAGGDLIGTNVSVGGDTEAMARHIVNVGPAGAGILEYQVEGVVRSRIAFSEADETLRIAAYDNAGTLLGIPLSVAMTAGAPLVHTSWNVWLPASSGTPHSTNPCSDLTRVAMSTNRRDVQVFAFDQTTSEKAVFEFIVPQYYAGGSLDVDVYWTASAGTTGDVLWRLRHANFADNGNLGGSTTNESSTGSDTFIATNRLHVHRVELPLPSGGFTAGEWVSIFVYRVTASDTFNADALLMGINVVENI